MALIDTLPDRSISIHFPVRNSSTYGKSSTRSREACALKALPAWKAFRLSLSICIIENSFISPCIIVFIFISDRTFFLSLHFSSFLPLFFVSEFLPSSSSQLFLCANQASGRGNIMRSLFGISHRMCGVKLGKGTKIFWMLKSKYVSTDAHEFSLFK